MIQTLDCRGKDGNHGKESALSTVTLVLSKSLGSDQSYRTLVVHECLHLWPDCTYCFFLSGVFLCCLSHRLFSCLNLRSFPPPAISNKTKHHPCQSRQLTLPKICLHKLFFLLICNSLGSFCFCLGFLIWQKDHDYHQERSSENTIFPLAQACLLQEPK